MNNLPWPLRVIFRTDLFFINRVFMPLAHWIDWRFHWSPYQQAYVVMWAALAMNVVSSAITFTLSPTWLGSIGLLSSALIVWTFQFYFRKFREAQRQYEIRPDVLCWAQVFFMGPHMALPRVFFLLMGLHLGCITAVLDLTRPPHRWADPAIAVLGFWMPVIAVALYLAGAFPPQRPRRKKEAPAETIPAGAALSPG
jgi:hypothetical protein